MTTHSYLMARFGAQFLGFDPKTHHYVLTGLFDERVVRYEPTSENESVLVFGDISRSRSVSAEAKIAHICEYAELCSTSFRLEVITVTSAPFGGPARVGEWRSKFLHSSGLPAGTRVALHRERGIVAHGPDLETVCEQVRALHLMGEVIFDVIS